MAKKMVSAQVWSIFALALLACVLTVAPALATAGKDELPNPDWDHACRSPFQVCSIVEVWRDWGEEKAGRLHFAVNALMDNPDNRDILTVWLLMDDPDVDFAKRIARESINVVFVYPRGTKMSTTHYTCTDAGTAVHDDQCWLSEKCAAELAAASAKKEELRNASYFAADQVVHDLNWVIQKLGDKRPNVVLAQGLSSLFALRLLQHHPDVPTGVILMDYVHPLKFDMYAYLSGVAQDAALQHLLGMCDDTVGCVGRLGAVESSWNRLQTLLFLAEEKKLSCAKKLNWGAGKLWGASFADQFRSVLSLMMRRPVYPYASGTADLLNLIPSMLYRLQRCTDKDIKALDALYTYVTGAKGINCPEDLPVQMLWLANDFVQSGAPRGKLDKYWTAESRQHVLLPAASHINAFHAAASKMPMLPRSPASRVLPQNATQKVLLLSADVDPLAPRGAANLVAIGFKSLGASVKVVSMRGIPNKPMELLAPCLLNNLRFYKSRTEWAEPEQCTRDASHMVDFLNGQTGDYYAAGDAWDYDQPNSDDGSSRGGGGGKKSRSAFRTFLKAMLWLLVVAGLAASGYFGYHYFKDHGFRYGRVSDNFYDNLHT